MTTTPQLEVRGWSIALALATVTTWLATLPRHMAGEVHTVSGSAWRGDAAVRVAVRDVANPTTAGDAAVLLRWRGSLPASQVALVDLGWGGEHPFWEARIRAVVDGVDVVATRMVAVTPAQVARLRERPEAGYAVLAELASGGAR